MEDIERFRQRWESDEHWAMRREFILQHRGRFSENRLLCLAQTYVNMELLGCVYPTAVAESVRELSASLPKTERPKIPKVAPVAFVKASAPSPPRDDRGPTLTSQATPQACSTAPPRQQFVGGFANRAGLGFESRKRPVSEESHDAGGVEKVARISAGKTAPAQSHVPPTSGPKDPILLPKFSAAAQLVKDDTIKGPNVIYKLQQIFIKCNLNFDVGFEELPVVKKQPPIFKCIITCDDVTLGEASYGNKKEAKRLAFQAVWDRLLQRPDTPKQQQLQQQQPCTRAPRLPLTHCKRDRGGPPEEPVSFPLTEKDNYLDLATLVVVQNSNCHGDPIVTLSRTADANRLRGTYEYEFNNSEFTCTYILGHREVKQATGSTKQEARAKAAAASLACLQSIAPTLRRKRLVDGRGPEVTKDEFGGPGNSRNSHEQIDSDNVGHKLLKMMGWSGGGIGKEGLGIIDPIMVKETSGRQGLGFTGGSAATNSSFKSKIHQLLQEFSNTVVLQDLVFSPQFDNEERKFVHSAARRYGLKSVSVDGPDGRFLTVRHKLSVRELVDTILASGPTEKYEVILPGQAQHEDEC